MELERLTKKTEEGKYVPDPDKYFSFKEKINMRAGYAFTTTPVTPRFIKKLAKFENIEGDFGIPMDVIISALTDGIVDNFGNQMVVLKLMLDVDTPENGGGWCLVHTKSTEPYQEEWYYLRDYGKKWNLRKSITSEED